MYQLTPDISIRFIANGDHEALFHVIESNRERLREYFPGTTRAIESLAAAETYVAERMQQVERKDGYCFVLTEGANIIGMVIIKEVNWRVPKCELAYFIDVTHEGKGIVSKAVKWTTGYCFETLTMEKICIMLNPANEGSRRVAISCGFVKEGYMRNEFRTGHGLLSDVEYYGLLKS